MKKLAVVIGLAVVCLLSGCLEPPKGGKTSDTGVLYRHHFAGATSIAAGTNATKLKEVMELPASKKMGAEAVAKIARAPRELWKKHLPAKAPDGAEFIRPLLEDIFNARSVVEVRGSSARPEFIVAVEVSDERAKLWDKNLKDLANAWQLGKPADVTLQSFKGWEIKRSAYPNRLQVVRAGKWVLAAWGSDKLPLSADFLQTAAKTGSPLKPLDTNVLLSLEADWPRIMPTVPALANFKLPPANVTISGRGEFLRTEAQLRYGQSLNWKFEPWKIPTNVIPDSIVSFTAAQGIAPLLRSIEGISDLGLKSLPNQFSMWGIGDAPGQIFAAAPVDNATNTIQKIAPTLPRLVLKHYPNAMGKFLWLSNRAEIVWQGVPFIVPYLQPLKSAGTDYLFFGMFPRVPASNQPPAELFSQLGNRKDLAYYDWEITGPRLAHARQLHQLAFIINKQLLPDTKSAGEQWLQALGDVIGPTITEIAVKSPTELSLVRKSHIGFTGFELATFSLWLESGGFPMRFNPRPPAPGSNAIPRKASSSLPSTPKK